MLVLIYTNTGQVLLMERLEPAEFWQSVTGSLDWNETSWQAAVREAKEETGLDVSGILIDCQTTNCYPILPAWRSRYAPDVDHNTEHVFRIAYPHCLDIQINPKEHRGFRWCSRNEAVQYAGSITNREAILRYVPGDAGGG